MDCRIPSGHLNTFQRITITYVDFLIYCIATKINDGNSDKNKLHVVWI